MTTIWALHIGQAPRFGHLKYPGHFLFNSHQAWYMISNTLYNYGWHVISVQNLIFHELKKKLFVTAAEYDWPKRGACPMCSAQIVMTDKSSSFFGVSAEDY